MPRFRSTALVLLAALLGCDNAQKAPAGAASTPKAPKPVASAAKAPDAAAARPKPKRPYNVLLIMIDSLRADMPWSGYERDIAPWLTKFEKRCVNYTRAYSISSYTAKSVGPTLVGAYPSEMKRDGYFFTKYHEDNVFISERAQDAGHRALAGHAHGYFMPALGNNQGFDDYRLTKGGVDLKAVKSITSEKLTNLAFEMLKDPKNVSQEGGKRFFAYFHYLDPHHTYEFHKGHPDFGRKARDLYDNEVHYTDSWVGKLVDWALEQPWGKDTAVIITSDHGEGFGEHNHFRHAYEVWEVLVRVPWFFYVPGAEGKRIDARRGHIDLAPTVADLMGLSMTPPFRGKSLVPEIFGDEKPKDRRVVVDLPRSDLMDRRRAVIADGYKIIAFGDERSFKLYHLDKDPNEEKDLVKEDPKAFEKMKAIYFEESKKIPNTPVIGGAPLKGAPAGQRW